MQIHLKFIIVEGAHEAFGRTDFTFELEGVSAGDLVRELMKNYGSPAEHVFLADGHYEENIQIIVNWRKFVPPERMDDFQLQDGDNILFTHMVEGG